MFKKASIAVALAALILGAGYSAAQSRVGGYSEPTEAGRVPDHLYNTILGRPTHDSITVSVLAHKDLEAFIEYGVSDSELMTATSIEQLVAGEPFEFVLDELSTNTEYHYEFNYRTDQDAEFQVWSQNSFRTPRSFDSDFVFTVQSDSHLDENTSASIYSTSLNNALKASPDFHLALGDTFLTGKYVDYRLAYPHYLAQRYYFGSFLNHSAPLFFALGNHDAESTRDMDQREWSTLMRNKFFPNPEPNEFYSGNPNKEYGDYVRNYYAFDWGNSLFIALDPFRYTEGRGENGNNWYMSLGKDQYDWLEETLTSSEATFKFVYLHNLVGGFESNRGGSEASYLFEWGGHEFDGTYTFDQNRPGWGKPIHQLLVENDVSMVFHGHDHMYIQQERDGIIYQLVPQPGHRAGNAGNATRYGYLTGNVVRGSGNIHVSVQQDRVQVDFIDSREENPGQVLHSYFFRAK